MRRCSAAGCPVQAFVVAATVAVFPIAHRLNLPCHHHRDTVFFNLLFLYLFSIKSEFADRP